MVLSECLNSVASDPFLSSNVPFGRVNGPNQMANGPLRRANVPNQTASVPNNSENGPFRHSNVRFHTEIVNSSPSELLKSLEEGAATE